MLFNIVMNDGTECTLRKLGFFSDGKKLRGVAVTAQAFLPLRRTLKNWRYD